MNAAQLFSHPSEAAAAHAHTSPVARLMPQQQPLPHPTGPHTAPGVRMPARPTCTRSLAAAHTGCCCVYSISSALEGMEDPAISSLQGGRVGPQSAVQAPVSSVGGVGCVHV
jgi:hypothetical protein